MKYLLLIIITICTFFNVHSQDTESDKISLFVALVESSKDSLLNDHHRRLLKDRLIQIVSRTGIANIGYSNFLIYPEFFILDQMTQESGLKNFEILKCEIVLHVSRTNLVDLPGAVFSSHSMTFSANGATQDEAITQAIRSLRPSDEGLVQFLEETKQEIYTYYNKNCSQIVYEAEKAFSLKHRRRALAMLLSVPSSAECYEKAREVTVKMYNEFLGEMCEKSIANLKSVATLASDPNISVQKKKEYQETMLVIVAGIDEASGCFNKVFNIMNAVSSEFSEEKKREWEMEKLRIEKEAEKKDILIVGANNFAQQVQPIYVDH